MGASPRKRPIATPTIPIGAVGAVGADGVLGRSLQPAVTASTTAVENHARLNAELLLIITTLSV